MHNHTGFSCAAALQVEKLKQSNALSKAAKKAEKKANKEAKKGKKRAAHQMEAALAAKGVGAPASSTQVLSRPQTAPDHPSRHGDPQPSSRHEPSYLRNSRSRVDDSPQGHGEDSSRAHKQRRLNSPERAKKTDRHRSSDRHQHEGADLRHNRDRDSRQHNGHAAAQEPHRQDSRHAASGHDKHNGAQTDSRNGHKYGLSWGETAPEELQARDRCASCTHSILVRKH